MKNIKALLTLEVNLIKPYWKWLIMFLGIAIAAGALMGGGVAFILNLMIFAATVLAFPFENVEKGNMEMLYAILPTNRKSMIFARYLFGLIFFAIVAIIGIGGGLLIDYIAMQIPNYVYVEGYGNQRFPRIMELPMYPQMFFTMVALGFAAYFLTFAIQTPFFYKYGYKKGRIFMWIPIIVIMAISLIPSLISMAGGPNVNLFNSMMGASASTQEGARQARLITTLVSIGAGILALVGSFFLSRKMYLKKNI